MELVALSPGGSVCMDEQSAKNVMVNIEKYRGALSKCNATIDAYNATVGK